MTRRGLGELERQVLGAIEHLSGQGYVVTIADDMKEQFGKIVSLGAIYATVDRLQNKGLISLVWARPLRNAVGNPNASTGLRLRVSVHWRKRVRQMIISGTKLRRREQSHDRRAVVPKRN